MTPRQIAMPVLDCHRVAGSPFTGVERHEKRGGRRGYLLELDDVRVHEVPMVDNLSGDTASDSAWVYKHQKERISKTKQGLPGVASSSGLRG